MARTPKGHVQVDNLEGFFDEDRLPNAIHLRALFGERVRIWADECRDPYVPCNRRGGVIYVYSNDCLAYEVESHSPKRSAARILELCPSTEVRQCGDCEVILIVRNDEAAGLARYAKPREMLSGEARRDLSDRMKESGAIERLRGM